MTVDLQQAARDHLWMHFTRMGGYASGEVPIIVRGDGCYLEDSNGKRYLDALAGLFSRQHRLRLRRGDRPGGARADARAAVLHELVVRAPARDRARRGGRVARARRPEPRLLRLRRLGGGRVGLEARAPVLPRARRQARVVRRAETRHDERVGTPPPRKYKAIARQIAYHGTTMGALSINGIPALQEPFEPLVPEVRHVQNTNRYHRPPEETEAEFTRVPAGRSRAARSSRWGPRRSASCTWSRCRTRAAPSRRRRATGAASASSATATTSCSRPTR